MAMPRLKPTLLSLYPRYVAPVGTRCLRNKPSSPLAVRQSALGIPMPSYDEVQKRVKQMTKRKKQGSKVPLVPKFGEDDTLLEPEVKSPEDLPKPRLEDMTPEERAEEEKLQASEARVRVFEREQKGLSGLSEEELLKTTFNDQVDALNEGVVEETPNTVTYPRDFVGTKYRKEKVKYKIDVYPTKDYLGFLNVPLHRTKMAQAAVEIIEDFHKQMNAEKLSEIMETENAAGELPVGVVLEEVDTRCLSLPFPPDAILPTMRLVFETMGNKVRYSLSDKQVNNITTGADFVKYLLSPPKPAVHPSPPTYLHSELSQIRFPPNVQILPDKQLEKKKRDTVAAIKSRQAKIERQRQEAELHEAALRRPEEERLARLAAEAEEERLQKEFEEQLAREEKEKEENYSQFYGRIR